MRFIRKGGRVIPIRGEGAAPKIKRIVKGAVKDAAVSGALTTALTHSANRGSISLKTAGKAGLKYGAALGAISLGVRSAVSISRAMKKRKQT